MKTGVALITLPATLSFARTSSDSLGRPSGSADRPKTALHAVLHLCSLAEIAMVQAADFGKLHDPPRRGKLDRPEVGCGLGEGPCLMVVGEISSQDAAEVSLAEDEHAIQALAPDRADEPLHERVLPRLCGAVRSSSIPVPLTRCRNGCPWTRRGRGRDRPARSRPGRRPRPAGRSSGRWGAPVTLK